MPVMRLKQQVGRCGSKPAVFPFPPGGGVMRGGREFPPGIDRCGLVPLPCRLPLKGGVMGAALAQTASPTAGKIIQSEAFFYPPFSPLLHVYLRNRPLVAFNENNCGTESLCDVSRHQPSLPFSMHEKAL